MAPRTLSIAWKAFEKQADAYLNETKSLDEVVQDLNNNAKKSNSAKIGHAIARLFFINYSELENLPVKFYIHPEDESSEDYPLWPTRYVEPILAQEATEETPAIKAVPGFMEINPLGIFDFINSCAEAAGLLSTPRVRRKFMTYRYYAFLNEIKKLPSNLIMFLLILQQIAKIKKITDVETKHGIEEAEGEVYLTMLWAFKELESFLDTTSGVNLRSEYKISWYESDWSIGI
jgi:hypothetical protein